MARSIGTKTAFVLAQPEDMPIAQVVELASAAGLELQNDAVSRIRYNARVREGKTKTKLVRERPPTTTSAPSVPPAHAMFDQKLLQLRRLILDLGMDTVREIWEEFERIHEGIAHRRQGAKA